jgi:hypothetical protein
VYDPDSGYKKPRGTDGDSFSMADIRNDDPVWSSHYSEEFGGEVYFYNRLTKESLWEKPSQFDGYDISQGKDHQKANQKPSEY